MPSSPKPQPKGPAVKPEPPAKALSQRQLAIAFALLIALVAIIYSNHFHNGFHFDDDHTVVHNPYIRDLNNASLFFTDARTISVLPANQVYRPMLTLSLAIDYWLGGGLKPLFFHLSTFFWFLLQIVVMFVPAAEGPLGLATGGPALAVYILAALLVLPLDGRKAAQ